MSVFSSAEAGMIYHAKSLKSVNWVESVFNLYAQGKLTKNLQKTAA